MDIVDFVLARYNYWIAIALMMVGLYTVIARGNLVKKIIGLNLFQTSVFIYYISIGKVTGGTAPIYTYDDMKARTGGGHSADAAGADHYDGEKVADALHAGVAGAGGHSANDLAAIIAGGAQVGATGGSADVAGAPLHASAGGGANDILAAQGVSGYALSTGGEAHASLAAHSAIEVVYSNPLPHVLILTAIVVGIATTAVGLSLAVRIREAYGTIEEDELEAADNIAEFGVADSAADAIVERR